MSTQSSSAEESPEVKGGGGLCAGYLHCEGSLLHVHVELVGVPAKQRIARVGVDAAQESIRGGYIYIYTN